MIIFSSARALRYIPFSSFSFACRRRRCRFASDCEAASDQSIDYWRDRHFINQSI